MSFPEWELVLCRIFSVKNFGYQKEEVIRQVPQTLKILDINSHRRGMGHDVVGNRDFSGKDVLVLRGGPCVF